MSKDLQIDDFGRYDMSTGFEGLEKETGQPFADIQEEYPEVSAVLVAACGCWVVEETDVDGKVDYACRVIHETAYGDWDEVWALLGPWHRGEHTV